MPVPFNTLPFHIRLGITEKTDFQDFRNLEQTCRQVNQNSLQLRRKITWEEKTFTIRDFDGEPGVKAAEMGHIAAGFIKGLEKLPVRIQAETFNLHAVFEPNGSYHKDLTDEQCSLFARFFQNTKSTAYCLFINSNHTRCSPENFASLLTACKAKKVRTRAIPVNCLITEAFRNLESISVKSALRDEDLIKLRADDIRIEEASITADGLNKFFKKWLSGSREITGIHIFSREGFWIYDVFADIEHDMEEFRRQAAYRNYRIYRGDQILKLEVCMLFRPQGRFSVIREDPVDEEESDSSDDSDFGYW